MLDVNHINGQQDNVKVFYAGGSTNWQTWQKPRGCSHVFMIAIGGAAGGYGGISGSAASGAPCGGSGAITRVLYTANLLPDTLYVQPGLCGAGGAGGTTAFATPTAGTFSYVSILPTSVSAQNLVLRSGATVANLQTGEAVAGANFGLSVSAIHFLSTGGSNGFQTANANPFSNGVITSGAPGGASNTTVGYNIPSSSISPQINGGQTAGANGSNGFTSFKPFYSLGGAGGAGNNSGAGGRGGDGGYGASGGGGGSGTTVGGAGGKGGDGLVVIATF